jgi:hypothetical protein
MLIFLKAYKYIEKKYKKIYQNLKQWLLLLGVEIMGDI